MSVRARFWQASQVMLAVHVVRTVFALALLDPFYRELLRLIAHGPQPRAAGLSWAELALESVVRTASWSWPWALWWLGSYALLAPLLGQSWLQALAGARGIRAAAQEAATRYPAALAVRVLWLLVLGAGAALGVAAVDRLLRITPPSASLELAARSVLAISWGLFAVRSLAMHDLTLARLATGGPLLAALRFGLRESSTTRVLRLLLALAAAAALSLSAEALGRLQPGWPGERWPSTLLALQQTLLFAALAARGVWLAYSIEHANKNLTAHE